MIEEYFQFEDFICYLNDDDKKITAFVEIIDTDSSCIKFATKQGNLLMIPWNRVLKVKQKGEICGK